MEGGGRTIRGGEDFGREEVSEGQGFVGRKKEGTSVHP